MNRLSLRTVSNVGRPSIRVVAPAIPAVQTRMASGGGGGGGPSARKGKKGGPVGDPRVRKFPPRLRFRSKAANGDDPQG